MKPPLNLLLASAALACVAFVGVWYANRHPGDLSAGKDAESVPSTKSKSGQGVNWVVKNTDSGTPSSTTSAAPAPTQPAAGDVQSSRGGATAQFYNPIESGIKTTGTNPTQIVPPAHLKGSREDLAARAAIVEAEANRELERLVPLLNLTPEQQDRVFAKLVENSVYWTPGMAAAAPTGGSAQKDAAMEAGKGTSATAQPISPIQNGKVTGVGNANPVMSSPSTPTVALDPVKSIPDLLTSPTDPILTPEQEADLYTSHLDQQEWWEELVGNIQTDMAGGTSTTGTGTASPPVDEVVPDLIIDGPVELQD